MIKLYDNGFNRRETNQILQIERSKLNRLLEQERSLRLAFVENVAKQFAAEPNLVFDAQKIWQQIENHAAIKNVQTRINILTDSYPQFLDQVNADRAKAERETRRKLEATNRTSLASQKTNNWSDEFVRVFGNTAAFA